MTDPILTVDGTLWDVNPDDGPYKREIDDPGLEVYVTVYEIERCYGGPEEGGWWYDDYTPLRVVPCLLSGAKEIRKRLQEDFSNEGRRDRFSVIGDSEYAINIELTMCESETRGRPVYC